nr:NADH-ubiquinone oxidoreductase subunit 6 [Ophiocordyceps sp.]
MIANLRSAQIFWVGEACEAALHAKSSNFTFYDIYLNGYTVEYLDILSIIALFFGITVIIIKNPIASLMSLIGLFASISIYLILLGLTFIGFSYLIVYIGAVSILFLFILMLINIRRSELHSYNWNSIPLALFVTILLNYALEPILPYYMTLIYSYNKINNMISMAFGGQAILNNDIIAKFNLWASLFFETCLNKVYAADHLNTRKVMFTTSNNWDGSMTETNHMSTIGNILYTSYNIWLFIASFILLLAMTGAIIITIKQDTDESV